MSINTSERKQLRQLLINRFNLNELKNLAFDIGVDFQLFTHNEKGSFSRELIAFCERRNKLPLLIAEALGQRPDSSFLVQLSAKITALETPHKKIQIIVTEDLLEDVSEFLDELAAKLNCTQDEVVLIGAAWGSMRLLVSFPEKQAVSLSGLQNQVFADSKYQILTIVDFESLDANYQDVWRFIVHEQPPKQQGNELHPSISWNEAAKAVIQKPFPTKVPSEQNMTNLLTKSERLITLLLNAYKRLEENIGDTWPEIAKQIQLKLDEISKFSNPNKIDIAVTAMLILLRNTSAISIVREIMREADDGNLTFEQSRFKSPFRSKTNIDEKLNESFDIMLEDFQAGMRRASAIWERGGYPQTLSGDAQEKSIDIPETRFINTGFFTIEGDYIDPKLPLVQTESPVVLRVNIGSFWGIGAPDKSFLMIC